MAKENIKSIELRVTSNREFFLIHGYTGSPTDFQRLPYILHKKFNANVRVILLPGHGTKIEDLDDVTYEDFMNNLRMEIENDIKKGREIVLGGVSLGGLFALQLASQYKVNGVFHVSSPYILKFPFNLIGLETVGKYIKYWKKFNTSVHERELRKGLFSYSHMHINGLKIIKFVSKEIKKNIHNITSPTLSIHSTGDNIGHHNALDYIHSNIGSVIKKKRMFFVKPHNIFFSKNNNEVYKEIVGFIEDKNIFSDTPVCKDKIAVIIPAYNEAKRIRPVLEVITSIRLVDDVIVVDDGSTDCTDDIVKKFKNIRYLKNETNIGKAGSMDKGVSATDADILFFCDADLIGLTRQIVESIITPVLIGTTDMFIGLRNNMMQKSIHLFAINSGERALRREVWEKLPHYFKHKYRVEAGLNYCAKKYFGGFNYKTFNYSQPIKENKYGIIKGTFLRWGMNVDVFFAYTRIVIEEFLQ